MARNKGTFQFAANFEVKAAAALDPRVAVATKAELIAKETWPYDGDTIYLYKGILVSVQSENAVYMLVDTDKILSTDYSGWLRVDAGNAEQVEVIDNLTSDSTTAALSAKQGKVLMGEITTLAGKLAGVYTYKGSVAKYENLPTEGLTAGDVYNVEEAHEGNAAGTNYAWTGSAWDALAGIVDLSNYYNKEEVDYQIGNALERFEETLNETWNENLTPVFGGIDRDIKSLQASTESASVQLGNINLILNGNDNPDDEIEDQVGVLGRLTAVEDKNDAQDIRLEALEKLVTGGGSGEEGEENPTLLQKVNANTLAIAQLQESTINGLTLVDDSGNAKAVILTGNDIEIGENDHDRIDDSLTLTEVVVSLQNSIDTINGDDNTAGSVDYKIKQAFEWIEAKA